MCRPGPAAGRVEGQVLALPAAPAAVPRGPCGTAEPERSAGCSQLADSFASRCGPAPVLQGLLLWLPCQVVLVCFSLYIWGVIGAPRRPLRSPVLLLYCHHSVLHATLQPACCRALAPMGQARALQLAFAWRRAREFTRPFPNSAAVLRRCHSPCPAAGSHAPPCDSISDVRCFPQAANGTEDCRQGRACCRRCRPGPPRHLAWGALCRHRRGVKLPGWLCSTETLQKGSSFAALLRPHAAQALAVQLQQVHRQRRPGLLLPGIGAVHADPAHLLWAHPVRPAPAGEPPVRAFPQ